MDGICRTSGEILNVCVHILWWSKFKGNKYRFGDIDIDGKVR
jgi:hypothetical protein